MFKLYCLFFVADEGETDNLAGKSTYSTLLEEMKTAILGYVNGMVGFSTTGRLSDSELYDIDGYWNFGVCDWFPDCTLTALFLFLRSLFTVAFTVQIYFTFTLHLIYCILQYIYANKVLFAADNKFTLQYVIQLLAITEFLFEWRIHFSAAFRNEFCFFRFKRQWIVRYWRILLWHF